MQSFLQQFAKIEHRRNNPVDPAGQPLSDILTQSNKYGSAIPVSILQQFAPGTRNHKTIQKGKGDIFYSTKHFENVSQPELQTIQMITKEITAVNTKVNEMIRLRGEKAYDIVSGAGSGSDAATNDLRKVAMTRQNTALALNSWVLLGLAIVTAVWIFTFTYMAIKRTFVMNMLIYPGVLILCLLYGYLFIPGYRLMLPRPA